MAEWMKTPLGTEVDLAPGHIVLDGIPAQQPPLFGPVYCGHGRQSQLPLSSCYDPVPEMTYNVFSGTLNPTHFTSLHLL